MQRISASSLSEFKAAKAALERMKFKVLSHSIFNDRTLQDEVYVTVRTPDSNTLIDSYYDYGGDVDVVYISAGGWMRRLAKQLENWK